MLEEEYEDHICNYSFDPITMRRRIISALISYVCAYMIKWAKKKHPPVRFHGTVFSEHPSFQARYQDKHTCCEKHRKQINLIKRNISNNLNLICMNDIHLTSKQALSIISSFSSRFSQMRTAMVLKMLLYCCEGLSLCLRHGRERPRTTTLATIVRVLPRHTNSPRYHSQKIGYILIIHEKNCFLMLI